MHAVKFFAEFVEVKIGVTPHPPHKLFHDSLKFSGLLSDASFQMHMLQSNLAPEAKWIEMLPNWKTISRSMWNKVIALFFNLLHSNTIRVQYCCSQALVPSFLHLPSSSLFKYLFEVTKPEIEKKSIWDIITILDTEPATYIWISAIEFCQKAEKQDGRYDTVPQ